MPADLDDLARDLRDLRDEVRACRKLLDEVRERQPGDADWDELRSRLNAVHAHQQAGVGWIALLREPRNLALLLAVLAAAFGGQEAQEAVHGMLGHDHRAQAEDTAPEPVERPRRPRRTAEDAPEAAEVLGTSPAAPAAPESEADAEAGPPPPGGDGGGAGD